MDQVKIRWTPIQTTMKVTVNWWFFGQVQISAYLDNVFDVSALMEDSETKTAALERVAELEDEVAHVSQFN